MDIQYPYGQLSSQQGSRPSDRVPGSTAGSPPEQTVPPAAQPAEAEVSPGDSQSQADYPDSTRKWSWGAFWLGIIYLFGNGAWQIGILILVLSIVLSAGLYYLPFVYQSVYSLFSGIIILGIEIFLGMRGRRIAWQKKDWSDGGHFARVQKEWDIWGFIIFGATILLTIVAVVATGV